MTATDWFEQLGFVLVTLFTLGCALGVILARRVLHAALWLLPTLIGVAGVFGLLGAHLLFAMQLIVYVGAITVLIIFGVMLLEDEARERLPRFLRYRLSGRWERPTNLVLHYYSGMQHVLGGVIAAGFMFVVIIVAVAEGAWFSEWGTLAPEGTSQFAGDNARLIGELFLTRYLLAFELSSIVLLVALVGAVVLARTDRPRVGSRLVASVPAASDSSADATSGVPTQKESAS